MKVLSIILLAMSYFQTFCQEEAEPEIPIEALEKDKLLACAEIVSRKFQTDSKAIEEAQNAFGEKERAASKISADMFSSCMNRIDEATTRSFFDNLVLIDVDWNDEINKLVKVDYSKYRRNTNDLDITPEQQLLFYKLEKAKAEYLSKTKQRTEEDRNTLKIGGFDLKKISPTVKMIYFLIVITVLIIGIIYLLSKVMKKKEPSKKKKSN